MTEERLKEIEDATRHETEGAGGFIDELLSEIRRLRDAERWIPVETKPSLYEPVLVATRTGKRIVDYWAGDGWGETDFWADDNVTHWRPLPELPKEGVLMPPSQRQAIRSKR